MLYNQLATQKSARRRQKPRALRSETAALTEKCLFFALSCLAATALLILAEKYILKTQPKPKAAAALLVILPYLSGGFYAYLAPAVSVFLLCCLIAQYRKSGSLRLYMNETLAAVTALLIAGAMSPLWGADSGMSAYGAVKALPLVLYVLLLMQCDGAERESAYALLPLCGAIMTLLCAALRFVPAFEGYVTVNHRLAGFFEYPNAYAAFLLVCLAISGTAKARPRFGAVIDALLVLGVFGSGSRTAFALMLLLIPAMMIVRREKRYCIEGVAIIALGFGLSYILGRLGSDVNAERYLTASVGASTFLGRLLYFKDALPVIAQHPLGLGYWGYFAAQGSFQTGVYTISFVHNGLLQLLLDYGWLPAALVVYALIRSFLSKSAGRTERFVMLVLLAHCMLDFDLQFTVMWLLLLLVSDVRRGKMRTLKRKSRLLLAAACLLTLLGGWLGTADALYRFGAVDACLGVMPFHTQALEQKLVDADTVQEMDDISERILALNENSHLAHNAQANVSLSQGNITRMIEEKERAIAYDRYSLDEYCDYISKLCAVMQMYLSAGDDASAQFCKNRLLSIPDMLSELQSQTDALAWRITDKPQLELPSEYKTAIDALEDME